MSETTRVILSVDERSLESLTKLLAQMRAPSPAHARLESCLLCEMIERLAVDGYTQLLARNPETNEERMISIAPEFFAPDSK